MAEARCASIHPQFSHIFQGKVERSEFFRAWRRTIVKRFYRTRNLIRNGMWPTSIYNLGVTTSFFSVLLVNDWEWAKSINSRLWYLEEFLPLGKYGVPFFLRVLLISFSGGVVFFIALMYKRRWLLRVLLSYRGWMYEPPRKQSWKTILWAGIVRVVSGYSPTTYSYQKSLPFLPVPKLTTTVDKFLKTMEPLHGKDSKEFKEMVEQAEEFKNTVGPKAQRVLVLKSWFAQNWCTDWWEKYVYLMGRNPIAINSNYYILDHSSWKPTDRQISRAASTIHTYLKVKRDIERENLPPLVIRGTIPLCMNQYERIFSTTRIPGEEVDEIVKHENSKHIVVVRKGIYYRLDVLDKRGNILTPQSFEDQIAWIMDDAEKHIESSSPSQCSIAALTGQNRTIWARQRQEYFSSGVNKDSLDITERAIFHVILDTKSFNTWSEHGKYLLHGDGKTLWFDKSFQLVFFKDGKLGINAEHAWGDAPVMAHVSEVNLTNEIVATDGIYDSNGFCQPATPAERAIVGMYDNEGQCKDVITQTPQAGLNYPYRLIWETPEPLEKAIDAAIEHNISNNDDLDLCVDDFTAFGKGFVKSCSVSPDAFIQLALQLAWNRDSGGKFALTYESSMTRLYLHGRTETVRALSNESSAFVKAMEDTTKTNKERIALMKEACRVHQLTYKDCMNGCGVDRHLFGLFVAIKGLGLESEFLQKALSCPWTLSTSQQPQQQIVDSPDCNLPQFKDKICPGGGFGPVSDQGYGVSYMVPGDDKFFFHVSSKHSTEATNSKRFMQTVFKSLSDMKKLFIEN